MKRIDYFSPEFDDYREAIEKLRSKGKDWDFIMYYGKENVEELETKLEHLREDFIIPEDLDASMWIDIVEALKEVAEHEENVEEQLESSRILSRQEDNKFTIPTNQRSSWQLYKNKLKKQGWTETSVDELEKTTISIVKKLRPEIEDPIKGLTIGHVQSGKTGSMAAMMAMAADWKFNVFIVLTGSIENLRQQTEDRLLGDLKTNGNLSWEFLKKLSFRSSSSHKVKNLVLGNDSRERYLNVCLKHTTRLNDLIDWLKDDGKKLSQMKIIIIDDESDQGGINTNDVNDPHTDRTAVNKAIVELVNIKANDGATPQSVNYVSYTATPYANFLNEATEESLYPKDFVAVLKPAKEYFGPKEIFGLDNNEEYRGLPIIRDIKKSDYELIQSIHREEVLTIPESFKDAINWFLIATSIMRYRKYKKPISMLIHTSHKQIHHSLFSQLIDNYFKGETKKNIIESCRCLYNEECKNFTKEDFELGFETYPDEIKDYPSFEKIEVELKRLINRRPSHINVLEDSKRLKYHDGLHLCIDNCSNNKITDNLEHIRLAYPDPGPNFPAPAPAFIVIGGSTLSRGLTIEGLVSTYFSRNTAQADTLLQMGRFFGYRRGYEMLPRIWTTKDIARKFRFMATLEEEMRDDIKTYITEGMAANEYGPKIKNSPKVSWLRVTAKKRMQSAEEIDLDFSGTSSQTVVFEDELDIQRKNIDITESFLNSLGNSKKTRNNRGIYWEDISFEEIKTGFFERFSFSPQSEFSDLQTFLEWYSLKENESGFTNWNVVLSSSGIIDQNKDKEWIINGHHIGLVSRSRRGAPGGKKINIGVLRTPADLYADMSKEEYDMVPEYFKPTKKGKAAFAAMEEEMEETEYKELKKSLINEIRKAAGLGSTPQLLLYRIDKCSKFDETKQPLNTKEMDKRYDLNASEDLIGVSIFVPGYRSGKNLSTKLTIRLSNPISDLELGEEEEEEGEV